MNTKKKETKEECHSTYIRPGKLHDLGTANADSLFPFSAGLRRCLDDDFPTMGEFSPTLYTASPLQSFEMISRPMGGVGLGSLERRNRK